MSLDTSCLNRLNQPNYALCLAEQPRARGSAYLAMGRRLKCQYRRANSRAPTVRSAQCLPVSRQDSQIGGRKPTWIPSACNCRAASRICSTVVPFSMASKIFCEPDSAPSQIISQLAFFRAATLSGWRTIKSARLRHLKGKWTPWVAHFLGKLRPPARFQPHNVIHKPDVVGLVGVLQPAHFGGDVVGATGVVALPPNGLGTPVAMVGATTGCDHVHGVSPVSLSPNGDDIFRHLTKSQAGRGRSSTAVSTGRRVYFGKCGHLSL